MTDKADEVIAKAAKACEVFKDRALPNHEITESERLMFESGYALGHLAGERAALSDVLKDMTEKA